MEVLLFLLRSGRRLLFASMVLAISPSTPYRVQQTQAYFTGVGNLQAFVEPQNVKSASATFNGTGNLSAYAQSAMQAAVQLGGVGAFSADSRIFRAAAATFSGVGNLSVYSVAWSGSGSTV